MVRPGAFVIALIAVLAACTTTKSEDDPLAHHPIAHPRTEHGYPMDDVLRMNHVQVKATHNSYHVETGGNTEPTWHYTHAPLAVQADTLGVRGFELDTRFVNEDHFEVFHLPLLDEMTTCRLFVDCLSQIKGWSDAHPGHAPIPIQVEPKDLPDPADPEPYFTKMEAEVLRVWPRERIVTPDDVQGSAATLHDAVRTAGWPTLGQTRGAIYFYIDNKDDWRKPYTRGGTSLANRLFFVDAEPDDPLAAVILKNDPADKPGIDAAVKDGLIVRTRADEAGTPESRAQALSTGGQILSSDFPDQFQIPDGTPARCNPIIAPPGCTAAAIEDPSRLR